MCAVICNLKIHGKFSSTSKRYSVYFQLPPPPPPQKKAGEKKYVNIRHASWELWIEILKTSFQSEKWGRYCIWEVCQRQRKIKRNLKTIALDYLSPSCCFKKCKLYKELELFWICSVLMGCVILTATLPWVWTVWVRAIAVFVCIKFIPSPSIRENLSCDILLGLQRGPSVYCLS